MTNWTKACEAMRDKAVQYLESLIADWNRDFMPRVCEAVRSLPLPTPPPSETGEGPVAWKLQSSDGNTHQIIESPPNPHDYEYWTVVPLYSSSSVPAREQVGGPVAWEVEAQGVSVDLYRTKEAAEAASVNYKGSRILPLYTHPSYSVPARELPEPSEEWVHRTALEVGRRTETSAQFIVEILKEYRKLAGANRAVEEATHTHGPSSNGPRPELPASSAASDRVREKVSKAVLSSIDLSSRLPVEDQIHRAIMAAYDAARGEQPR